MGLCTSKAACVSVLQLVMASTAESLARMKSGSVCLASGAGFAVC